MNAKWVLSQTSFDALLEHLDRDRDMAGASYERLRRKLITFFRSRGFPHADEDADETLNRVARRIAEGEVVRDIYGYAAGVAQLRAKELYRGRLREATTPLAGYAPPAPLATRPEDASALDARMRRLELCLSQLDGPSRDILVRYYVGDHSERIAARRSLARRLGVSINALRIRAFRLRSQLERCVRQGVER